MSGGIPRFGHEVPEPRVETKAYRFPASSTASASIGDDYAARLELAEERARLAEQQLSIAAQALAAQQGQGALMLQMLVEANALARDLQRDCDDLRRGNVEYQVKLTQKNVLIAELAAAGYQVEADRLERAYAEIRAQFEAAMTVISAPLHLDDESDAIVVDVELPEKGAS